MCVLIPLIMKLSSTDEPQIESWEDRNPGEILDIRFQKNPNQKLKYLEAEPKILGVRVLYSSADILFFFFAYKLLFMDVKNYCTE